MQQPARDPAPALPQEDALAYYTQGVRRDGSLPRPANRDEAPNDALDQMFGYWSA